jgi:hypothetical protein
MRSMLLAIVLVVMPLAAQVKFTTHPDRISVEIDGKPYTDFFLSADGNKPYIWPLSTASGIVVTRHFPMENAPGETNDHPHHRGLFFSHGDINGNNFWATEASEPNPPKGPKKASMKLVKVAEAKGGAKSGTIKAVFTGLDAQGKPIMTETRTVTFHSDPKLRTIDYEILIDPLEQLKFVDTKEGTFGIRLATSMTEDAKQGGKMIASTGAETEKNVWGKRFPWVDYDGPVNGQTVGVAIFDNPANPRYPTYWHSRAYGLFAANPFGVHDFTGDKQQDGSLTVNAHETLRFRYRVVIHPGDVHTANIAELYKQYTAGK